MDFHDIILFVFVETLACLSPGPAVIYIVFQGINNNFKNTTFSILGILAGNLIFFLLSSFSIGLIVLKSSVLFKTIRFLGAMYLLYLGILYFSKSNNNSLHYKNKRKGFSSFVEGMLLQLSNPKAIIFFISLYPQFINVERSVFSQFLLIGALSIVIEFVILSVYGKSAVQLSRVIKKEKYVKMINRLCCGFLMIISISFLVTLFY